MSHQHLLPMAMSAAVLSCARRSSRVHLCSVPYLQLAPPPPDVTLPRKKARALENHTTRHSSCSILAFPYLSSPTATLAHKGHRGPQGASQADASPSEHLHSNARVSISCSQCPRDQSAFHTKLVLCRNKPLPVSDTTDHDENFVCFNEQNSRYIYMGIYNQNHP